MPRLILVTGAGGPAGRALLASLAERGVAAMGADLAPVTGTEWPVVRIPAARDAAYVPALRDLVAERGIDVVVPTVSEELPRIAAVRDDLAPGVRVVVAAPEAVAVADDKLATARALAAADVPVPASLGADEIASPADAVRRIGLPLVVKPRISRGARGVRVVRSADALAGPHAPAAGDVLQSFAPGTEYAPVVHVPLHGAGEPFVAVLEKTGLTAGEVGNATGVRRVDGPAVADVADVAVAAVRAAGLTGPVDVDVRRDAAGVPRVLELNARFGANSRAVPELVDRFLHDLRDATALGPIAVSAVSTVPAP